MAEPGFRKVRIDPALWRAALVTAQTRGETVTEVIGAALRAYVATPSQCPNHDDTQICPDCTS